MLFEVSMLAAPFVDFRISRRCASSPRKNGAGFCMIGLLQDTAINSEVTSLGGQFEMIVRRVDRKPRRLWVEMQRGDARLIVESFVFKHDISRSKHLARADAPALAPLAAHLEQIGEVVVEQPASDRSSPAGRHDFATRCAGRRNAPQKYRTHDVQRILCNASRPSR